MVTKLEDDKHLQLLKTPSNFLSSIMTQVPGEVSQFSPSTGSIWSHAPYGPRDNCQTIQLEYLNRYNDW